MLWSTKLRTRSQSPDIADTRTSGASTAGRGRGRQNAGSRTERSSLDPARSVLTTPRRPAYRPGRPGAALRVFVVSTGECWDDPGRNDPPEATAAGNVAAVELLSRPAFGPRRPADALAPAPPSDVVSTGECWDDPGRNDPPEATAAGNVAAVELLSRPAFGPRRPADALDSRHHQAAHLTRLARRCPTRA